LWPEQDNLQGLNKSTTLPAEKANIK